MLTWQMTTRNPPPDGIDITRPNVARIYDYMLGGKDNFAVDREAAKQLIAVAPDIAGIVRDNRSFLGRVVRYLADEAGVRQFLDLGGGLPTRTNVHEMAQSIAPDARVVYVDNDPVVWSHGQALLAHGDRVAMVRADLREPAEVLEHPEVLARLDLDRPVAVLCASVLHFVADEEKPYQIIAQYRDRLAPGSYLAISHGTTGPAEEDRDVVGGVTSVYRQASAQLHVRPLAGIQRFFDGFEMVDPGLVWINEWRPGAGFQPAGQPRSLRGGVGRKPEAAR
jgi:O-methyltransferase involved in polyketide biosynthesis